jgi:hypothetical protein
VKKAAQVAAFFETGVEVQLIPTNKACMEWHPPGRYDQAGFIQAALLFGVAIMTIVLSGFALGNHQPTGQVDNEQAKLSAAVALKQAANLGEGVLRYRSSLGAKAVTYVMDFTVTSNIGLFDPAAQFASPQVMPSSAFASNPNPIHSASTNTAGHWYLNKLTPGNGIASPAADVLVTLPGLRADVCSRINKLLYGSSTIPIATGNLAAWSTSPADGGISTVAAVSNWDQGCVQAIAASGQYVFFKVVQEE